MSASTTTPPIDLVEHIAARRCALFLGPDAAESAVGYRGLPTSWQLADELAARSDYRGAYRPFPQIAQVYQHARGRLDLIRYLHERLVDPAYQPLPIHELIARIPFAAIVDASWHGLLERALDGRGVPYQVVQSAQDIPYALPTDGLLLYKPFGSLDQPDSLVITEDDQLDVFYQLRTLKRRLAELVASHALLMVGYAPDYDSVFVRIYHEIRHEQGEHRLPAFVVESLSQPEDVAQWEARGIRPLVAEPVPFLYELAKAVAQVEGRAADLPDLASISRAPAVTAADMAAQTETLNRVMETLGVGDLVEQSDVPLLSPQQVRDLEAMRAAYERLAESLTPVEGSASVWLRQGNVEYVRQNYDNARRYYELALDAQPGLAEAYHNLHYVYLAQRQWQDALAAYQQAVALNPDLAILPGRYQIDAVLGRGGVGVVYRAIDQQTGQVVAVKLLDRAYMRTEQVVRRFRREADILQRLEHPNIVAFLDFQQYQGRYFLVMEYLGQQTLARLLAEQERLALDQAHGLFQQACQAIGYAHQHNIIHRDIKPANIFLVDGQVKLIDFGLAADLEAGQPSLIGQATGTVAYMAPEQQAGAAVDQRTDVYALGTVFYEMITGRHPGQGAYRPASQLVPGLNDALDIVLQKARERRPEERYPGVAALCQEVARVVPLQPASRQAPLWLRGLSRLQQALGLAVSRFWPLLLLIVAVAGIPFPGPLSLAGFLVWDVLLLVLLADWFTAWLARRSGYPSLAANGPLLGALLGISIGLITFLLSEPGVTFDTSGERYLDYTFFLLIHAIFAVVVGGFSFLAMALGTQLGLRLRLPARLRVFLGLGLALIVLALYALFMISQFV